MARVLHDWPHLSPLLAEHLGSARGAAVDQWIQEKLEETIRYMWRRSASLKLEGLGVSRQP